MSVSTLTWSGFETEILQASEDSPFLAALLEFSSDEVVEAVDEMRRVLPGGDADCKLDAPWVYVRRIPSKVRASLKLKPSHVYDSLAGDSCSSQLSLTTSIKRFASRREHCAMAEYHA